MDFDYVLTAVVLASSVFSGFVAIRNRAKRWLFVLALNLVVLGLSWAFFRGKVSYISGPIWVLTMLGPSLAIQAADRLSRRERFAAATWVSRIAALLHPSPLTKQRVLVAEAQRLEQAGEVEASRHVLARLAEQPGAKLLATLLGLRLDQRWDSIRELIESDPARAAFNPSAFSFWLRSLGETGAREQLLAAWAASAKAKHNAPVESQVFLFAAAFGGREEATRNILAAQHSDLPDEARELWLLTAARERRDVSKELEALAARAKPRIALVARARLAADPPEPLSEASIEILDRLEKEAAALDSMRAPEPRATTALALLNAYVFLREIPRGTTNLANLHRLGALYTGEMENLWRLATAATLHYGFAHVAMNVVALLVLGPSVEAALGRGRMLLIYLASGIGANALAVWWTGAGHSKPALLVGASGAVMGIAGALLVLHALRWRKRKTIAARSETIRLAAVFVIQVISDELIPNVAGSVHIFGAILGMLLALALPRSKGTPAERSKRGGWALTAAFLFGSIGLVELAWSQPQPYFSTHACEEDRDEAACQADCEALFGPLDAGALPAPNQLPNRDVLLESCGHHAYYANQHGRERESYFVFEATCRAGSPLACSNEAVFIENGFLGRPDFAKAYELYRRACEGGMKEACANADRLAPN